MYVLLGKKAFCSCNEVRNPTGEPWTTVRSSRPCRIWVAVKELNQVTIMGINIYIGYIGYLGYLGFRIYMVT